MIIDTSQGDVQVIGDIKEFKTSIDPRNLEFITTLLSSNLYSDPEQSFIREIVSNAWDSHVEAGNTDTPVIIKIKSGIDKSITIRDYGTGISPQRFQEIYCNIGSSTKRDTNSFIGGFGIGRFSAVACSNTVYITSYYEGTCYQYVMVKSNNTITINLIMESPTTEKNGVEVSIKSIDNLNPYIKALSCVAFFPNIYVDGTLCSYINELKIKKFKNFAASTQIFKQRFLLGNVLYECNTSLLSDKNRYFIRSLNDTGIVIRFDIGELEITPNRENIIYNSKTLDIIEKRINDAREEMYSIISKSISRDYDNLKEYVDIFGGRNSFDFITNESSDKRDCTKFAYRVNELPDSTITYKGKSLLDYNINHIHSLLESTIPNFKCIIYDNKIHVKSRNYYVAKLGFISADKILILNKNARLVAAAQKYLKENYRNYAVMTETSVDEFYVYVKIAYPHISLPAFIIKEIYQYLIDKAETLDLDNDKKYLDYKQELKDSTPKGHRNITNVILYVWREPLHYHSMIKHKEEFSDIDKAVEYIKRAKKGVIINNIGNDTEFFTSVAEIRKYIYIEAKKEVVKYLKELNLSCYIDTDWLMYKDPILSKTKTVLETLRMYTSDSIIPPAYFDLSYTLPEEDLILFKDLVKTVRSYIYMYNYREKALRDSIPLDPDVQKLCYRLNKYYDKYMRIKKIVSESVTPDHNSEDVIAAALMKSKSYRINGKAYNKVKNNKLLRILCKK